MFYIIIQELKPKPKKDDVCSGTKRVKASVSYIWAIPNSLFLS